MKLRSILSSKINIKIQKCQKDKGKRVLSIEAISSLNVSLISP